MDISQKTLPRIFPYLLTSALCAALLAGASFPEPEWPQELGFDFWSLSDLDPEFHAEQRRRADLDALDATALQRVALKDAVIRDLLNGRMTLVEAAGQFRRINDNYANADAILRLMFPGTTTEEALCRNVLTFVEMSLQNEPDQGAPVLHELRGELALLSAVHGGIVLR